MSNFAPISNVLGRQTSASDLATWTLISPSTAGDRDRVLIHNFSTSILFIRFTGVGESAPTGTDTTLADLAIAPNQGVDFPVGASVGVYGLHAASRTTGYCLREGA